MLGLENHSITEKQSLMLENGSIIFNHYKVVEKIFHGAFSIVYKVYDEDDSKYKCMKVEIKDDNKYTSMINHEFHISQMVDSKYICKAYEYHGDSIIMEMLSNNLANIRRLRMNPPSISMLLNITVNMLRCLDALDKKGIVHCDIKPSNFAIRKYENDYDVVLLDFGLSYFAGEDKSISDFRKKLERNPRYLTIHTIETNEWNENDDVGALIYTISDFWKNELPWDGRTTKNTVMEIKNGYNLYSLLPNELSFLIQHRNESVSFLCEIAENELKKYKRNIKEEIHYLFDPQDKDWKPKIVNYVFENKDQKRKYKNQHSAF